MTNHPTIARLAAALLAMTSCAVAAQDPSHGKPVPARLHHVHATHATHATEQVAYLARVVPAPIAAPASAHDPWAPRACVRVDSRMVC